jgi:hypothetical protein
MSALYLCLAYLTLETKLSSSLIYQCFNFQPLIQLYRIVYGLTQMLHLQKNLDSLKLVFVYFCSYYFEIYFLFSSFLDRHTFWFLILLKFNISFQDLKSKVLILFNQINVATHLILACFKENLELFYNYYWFWNLNRQLLKSNHHSSSSLESQWPK